jgi:hypothetical protein
VYSHDLQLPLARLLCRVLVHRRPLIKSFEHTFEMPKVIKPVEDEWFGVQDSKKRKQIQDRLAQRARRKYTVPLVLFIYQLLGPYILNIVSDQV